MWARALFAVRRFLLDLGPNLGSWRLSVVLMVLGAVYYLLLAVWATASPAEVVGNIAGLFPFWIVYALLLVNTTVCFWRRLPMLRRDLSRRGTAQLGAFLFHGAFLLVGSGFLLTLLARQEARAWVVLGEEFEAQPEQYLARSPPRRLVAGVPPLRFRVERIEPRFWADQLLFTELVADLRLADGTLARTRINRPLWLGPATFLRLSGFGWAPRFELVDARGLRIDSAVVKLNVFPPGIRDYFVLPRFPHRVKVRFYPDYDPQPSGPATRTMNLVDPAFAVEVSRGRVDLGGGIVRMGESLEFEGLSLSFPEILSWGEFSIVWDPGAPVLFAGYLFGLLGLLLKLGSSLRGLSPSAEEGRG